MKEELSERTIYKCRVEFIKKGIPRNALIRSGMTGDSFIKHICVEETERLMDGDTPYKLPEFFFLMYK